jgi:hypothetical protein
MKIVTALLAALLLGGCSLADVIKSNTSDYTQTYDETANISLVTNILRARDYAPLNFSALSDIHMQITVGGSVATTAPVGPVAFDGIKAMLTRQTVGTGMQGINGSINPSFEIAPLDTQEFTRGILTPIDPLLVKYYLDRELPQKLLMFLLFADIKTSDTYASSEHVATGAPVKPRRPAQYFNDPTQLQQLEQFAAYVDEIIGDGPDVHIVTANRYTTLVPIGPEFSFAPDAKDLKDMTALDPAKFRLAYLPKGKKAQLYSVRPDPEIVFCRNSVPLPMVGLADDINMGKIAFPTIGLPIAPPTTANAPPTRAPRAAKEPTPPTGADFAAAIRNSWKSVCNANIAPMTPDGPIGAANFGSITIRSVEAIIQYLGALVRNPQAAAIVQKHLHYSLISLNQNEALARFAVNYMGTTYYVREVGKGDDRTLQVLSLLTQLVNLNKVAKEIPTTRDVEVVP